MSALARTFAGLFLASSVAVIAGCSADDGGTAQSSDLVAAQNGTTPAKQTLTEKVKAAYEQSRAENKPYWLPGEQPVDASKLPGDAARDFAADAETCQGYGYGYPEARVATIDGETVYAISGIVSDTGDILGFYDASGNELCEAYSGQGEQPNEGGVDWWK